MGKIKILAVFGSLQRGGAETMYMNLYRNIDHDKYQIDFLVKEHTVDGYEEEVRACGSRIFLVQSAKEKGVWGFVKGVEKAIRENGLYDVVHSHVNCLSGLVLLGAWKAGVPLRIAHSHNTHFSVSPQNAFAGKLLIRFFANRRISCGIEAGKALFLRKKSVLLPNGINTDRFLPGDMEAKRDLKSGLKLNNDKKYIVHIGRFDKQKNHIFLLRMFAELLKSASDYHLLLLGDGPLLNEMKQQASTLHIGQFVSFLGSVPNANEYLRAADLFVLPSLFEGLPVSAVEAQCASLPCLLSSEITTEADLGLGLVSFVPLQEKAWIEAISRVSNTPLPNRGTIKQTFIAKGMDAKSNVDTLLRIYCSDEK